MELLAGQAGAVDGLLVRDPPGRPFRSIAAPVPPRAASELAQRLKAELHLVESLLDQDTDTIAHMAVQAASLRVKLKSRSELEEPVLSNQGDDLAVDD